MPINQVIGRASISPTNHSWQRAAMPPVPTEIAEIQAAAVKNHPKHSWTGVNFIHKNSAADVQRHLGDVRDAARTLVHGNTDMFVLRHSYKTREPMHAFLGSKPKDGKLKLQVTITPSWHANAPDSYSVTRALANKEPKDLTALDVVEAFRGSARFSKTIEDELGPVERWGQRTFESMKAAFTGDVKKDRELVKAYIEDIGQTAMGQKFSRENVYEVLVKLPDGKSIKKVFDVSGKESSTSTRYDKAVHASISPEIEIDISQYAGKEIVVEAYPYGSAGVGGYPEARRTIVHID